ncbi:MAG TPA: SagB/ThcOx family dehydrogenase [Acidimicrobiia bacterium]
MNEPEAAVAFHLQTRHGSPVDRSRLVDFQPLDPTNRPAPFKRYAGREPRPLPRAIDEPGDLGRLLFLTAGVTRVTDSRALDGRTYFRAAMSAGNLHPVELYVVGADGVDHYDPLGHGLTRLRGASGPPAGGATVIVLTGIPWRTAWKYGERGYRHLFWDAGACLANLLAVAAADGVTARVWLGFDDDAVARVVGVDGITEFPLAVVTLGGDAGPPDWPPVDALDLDVEAISPRPIEFPLITTTHRAGALAAGAVEAWRAAAAAFDGEPAASDIALPGGRELPPVEDLILARGSTRMMRRETAPRELLDRGMAGASSPVPGDFVAAGRTLLSHFLSVHGIEGVPSGAYRWHADVRELAAIRLGEVREAAELLCLRQPLGGDSAFTAFHSADLDPVLRALGTRGYRAAELESGIAAGRLSLAAFALGYGATGLTFFDAAVSQFFETDAACMLVTSVGVPAYRNTRGGGPGATSELTRYGDLMTRLSLQLHRTGR